MLGRVHPPGAGARCPAWPLPRWFCLCLAGKQVGYGMCPRLWSCAFAALFGSQHPNTLCSLPCSEVPGVVAETGFNSSWEEGICTGCLSVNYLHALFCFSLPCPLCRIPFTLGPRIQLCSLGVRFSYMRTVVSCSRFSFTTRLVA